MTLHSAIHHVEESILFTDIDDCTSQPCLNHGTCNDQVNSFKCNCKQGFTGPRCETGN